MDGLKGCGEQMKILIAGLLLAGKAAEGTAGGASGAEWFGDATYTNDYSIDYSICLYRKACN